jgi:hypothetical protein
MLCESDAFGCPGLTAKGRRNRFTAIHQLPRRQTILSGGRSELSGKGVCVKRCFFCFFLCAWLIVAAGPLFAETASPSSAQIQAAPQPLPDFGGQIISGYEGKRIGIGTREPAATLDVYKGEIKIGSTGAACTKALDGALRAENSKLQFCDGANWRNVSLDKDR